jgi:hypothetical protein
MENMRNQIDVKLVTNVIAAERYIAQPNFESFTIINEDLTQIKMSKT